MFSYVPQGNALMNGTIREIVSFGDPSASHDDERIQRALVASCADEFIHDLDATLGERGTGLSEGQMQRLAIARAVFADAPVLLLDEATSALDEQTEKRLIKSLRSMTEKTVVLVTHRRTVMQIADRIFQFDEDGISAQEGKKI